jgi:hypothetical protein
MAPIDGVEDVLNHFDLASHNRLFALPLKAGKRTHGDISGNANLALCAA